ncbi:MAG: hypothetical protein ABI462_08535 [Ignavibacteria bacterium]
MKNKLPCLVLIYIFIMTAVTFSQQDGDVSLDMLRAPMSPAFQLLEVDVSKIERPTNPTDFMVSLLQSTNELTVFPKNYSLEISPYWVFGGMNTSYRSFASDASIKNNILQSFVFSLANVSATDTVTNIDNRKISVGMKFSILRGNKISRDFEKVVEKLKSVNKKFTEFGDLRDSDPAYIELTKIKTSLLEKEDIESADKVNVLLDLREQELLKQFNIEGSDEVKELKEVAADTKFNRYGWKLDFAMGCGFEFPTNDFNYSLVNKAGTWLTGGYEDEKSGMTGLLLARILGNPNSSVSSGAKENVLELGGRIILDKFHKFSISGEFVNRIILKGDNKESKLRYTLNLSYEIFKNKLLTFNIEEFGILNLSNMGFDQFGIYNFGLEFRIGDLEFRIGDLEFRIGDLEFG